MVGHIFMFTITLLLCWCVSSNARAFCTRGDPCWPTSENVTALINALDPLATRAIPWEGPGTPRPTAVPVDSVHDQPFYGYNTNIQPVYVQDEKNVDYTCYLNYFTPASCVSATRNNPIEGWTPAFVVFALTAVHVQTAVRFALAHNLCIMVAGTGHDFMNRHSCDQGIFIRTTLLQSYEWATDNSSITLGAGTTFSTAQNITSKRNRFVAGGWAITVGAIGWSIGGGHGPNGPSHGLGVDNIVGVSLVSATGDLLQVNAESHPDLFWALRGGGGSTWGIIVNITVRAHVTSPGGITKANLLRGGSFCGEGRVQLQLYMERYIAWALELDSAWSGLVFFSPSNTPTDDCDASWSIFVQYFYQGPPTDAAFLLAWGNITTGIPSLHWTAAYDTWWDAAVVYGLEPITPVPWLPPTPQSAGGVPSTLVSREMSANGTLASVLSDMLDIGYANKWEWSYQLYQDITGNVGSPHATNVSISPAFRTALFHLVGGGPVDFLESHLYTLGPNSYMSESAYNMSGWQARLWGSNYPSLLAIKQRYDPNNTFWCHHCVGSESISFPTVHQQLAPHKNPAPSGGVIAGIVVGSLCGIALIAGGLYYVLGHRKAARRHARFDPLAEPLTG